MKKELWRALLGLNSANKAYVVKEVFMKKELWHYPNNAYLTFISELEKKSLWKKNCDTVPPA